MSVFLEIGERDSFMAKSIIDSPSQVLVGVVGLAHIAGMEMNLVNAGGFKPIARNCPAPKR